MGLFQQRWIAGRCCVCGTGGTRQSRSKWWCQKCWDIAKAEKKRRKARRST